jgi:hypothetical protein
MDLEKAKNIGKGSKCKGKDKRKRKTVKGTLLQNWELQALGNAPSAAVELGLQRLL